MIRYNNILRPVQDPNDPLCDPLRPTRPLPVQNLGGRDPQPSGLTPMDAE